MNSETHIVDFFKRSFRDLAKRKKALKGRVLPSNIGLSAEIALTYNIACEVLGADVAGLMLDERGL